MPYWVDENRRPREPMRPPTGPVWWKTGGDGDEELVKRHRADSLLDCARRLENAQRDVHEQNLWNAQLYSNRELAAFDWGNGGLYRASLAPVSRTGENIVLHVVDSLVAIIGKNRPKATPVCLGASWALRVAAKRLDKFLYGEFMRNDVYNLGKLVFRDACIFGFGVLHTTVEDDKEVGARVCVERVFPDEILVDQAEVVSTGRVTHLYRRRVLPVEVVAAMWPSVKVEDLIVTGVGQERYLPYRDVGDGWVVVVEGWQVGGRYMAATPGRILDEKPWKHDWLPFTFLQYQIPPSGFYGVSAVEQALEYQIRLNEINEIIRDAQDLMSRPRIFVQEGTQVNPLDFDNRVGRIIKVRGALPEPQVWPAVPAELYNERDRCWSQCRAQFGLGDIASTAQAPSQARFDSSAAFREFNAIQDDRLSDLAQRYESLYLELAKCMIRVIRASGSAPRTTWYSGGRRSRAEVIEWKDIDLDDEAYVLQLQASSIYNMTPAAQKDELAAQLARGEITPEQYRLECVHPDLESEASIGAAAAADINRIIELLENGEFEYPDRAQDLAQGVQRVTLAYLNLKQYEGVPVDVRLNMLDWITAARSIMEQATEESMPPPSANAPLDPAMAGGGAAAAGPMNFTAPPAMPATGMMQ